MSVESLYSLPHNPVRKRTLIVGPMGAGKSTELCKWIVRAGMDYSKKPRDRDLTEEDITSVYENQVMVIVFDETGKGGKTRVGGMKLHSGIRSPIRTHLVTKIEDILSHPQFKVAKVVFVDEGQFIPDLRVLFYTCLTEKKDLIVGALDKDVNMNQFPSISECLGFATHVIKMVGRCEDCSKPSRHTILRRKKECGRACNVPVVICVGGFEQYKPVCDDCLLLTIAEEK